MNKSEITEVAFLIFPGFPMSCLTSVIEPLRAANEIAGQDSFAWRLVSEDGQKVLSSAHVVFEPDAALQALDTPDMVILLSEPLSRFKASKQANGVLRKLARRGVILGGISGGVFPLVRSGVMAGHGCSVHWCYEAAFRAEFPDAPMMDEVIVTDRRRYTASGAAAGFELSLRLIEQKLSAALAHEVACWFQHPMMRGEGVRQRVPASTSIDSALPDLVARGVALFAERISDPISVAEVARALQVTPRQVERAFKKATGMNPTRYYRDMRMQAARQMVLYTKDSMAQIAHAVGYTTPAPLLTHYRAAFGISPQEDRLRINALRVEKGAVVPFA